MADLIKQGFSTVLEPGTDIEGKLTVSPGRAARLNSHFQGEILGEGKLVIAERGEVEAEVDCKSIVVLGKIKGSVHASERVEIKKRGVVLGEVYTPVFIVEPGAYFDGYCHMPAESQLGAKVTEASDDPVATIDTSR